jgi:hypothetical protein
MIDLPSQVGVGINMDEGTSASVMKDRKGETEVKMRMINSSYTANESNKTAGGAKVKFYVEDEEAKGVPVKHYDADGV